MEINLNSKWVVEKSVVYYHIKNEEGELIAFMSVNGNDKKNAQRICDLHNAAISNGDVGEGCL